MVIKTTKQQTDLAPEGEYPATLRQVAYKNENKKAVLTFEVEYAANTRLVPREVPASVDSGPLRKDLEILHGREFTRKEVEEGIDPEKYVGVKCRGVVSHKRASGGRVVAVVNLLLPLAAPPASTTTPPETPAPVEKPTAE